MVSVPVEAPDMTKKITVDVYANNNKVKSTSTTLKDVAEKTIAESTSKLEVDYLKTMLNYGGYTQEVFNKNLDVMAYQNVKAELQQSMNKITDETFSKYKTIVDGEQNGVSIKAISLTTDSLISINCKFNIESSINVSDLETKIDGEDSTISKNSNVYYLKLANVPYNKLDEIHQFKVGNISVKASAFSYGYSCMKYAPNSTVAMQIKAMYLFQQAAKTYLG